MPGPQHHLPVKVTDLTGNHVASATCFFATYSDDTGAPRWRGFLTFIDPAGSIRPGDYRLELPDGGMTAVQVRDVRTENREQAIFAGTGDPPAIPT